jgi:hypothetical protein
MIGLLMLGVLVGCGSDRNTGAPDGASGGTPPFMTAVPGTTPLGQLTQAQFGTLCGDVATYRSLLAADPSFRAVYCAFGGITAATRAAGPSATDADVQQACSAAASSCMSAPQQPFTLACEVTVSATCTATVAQYTTCLDDSVAAAEVSVAAIPSCDSLTVAELRGDGDTLGTPTPPASCATYDAACPISGGGSGDLPSPALSPEALAPNP